jgi:hypothetical protein
VSESIIIILGSIRKQARKNKVLEGRESTRHLLLCCVSCHIVVFHTANVSYGGEMQGDNNNIVVMTGREG